MCAMCASLYTRGAKKDEFAALDRYFKSPNPQALLIFVADFLRIPTDTRRMEMDDKNRFERLTETLGEHCGMVELARVAEEDAMRWAVATAQAAETKLGAGRGARAGGCAGRGHDADCVGAGEAAALHAWAAAASRWATWRRWCWPPSSARSMN